MTAMIPRRSYQRLIVALSVLMFVLAYLVLPRMHDDAVGQPQSPEQQPFACQQEGMPDPQQRRQHLPLTTSGGSTGAGAMYPCLSGVPWVFRVGNTNSSSDEEVIAVAANVYSPGARTLYWAASGNSSDLYQVAFSGLNICSGPGQPVSQCRIGVNNTDDNAANNLELFASTAQMAPPRPATDYTLRFAPDSGMVIGGSNVYTDLWVTGSSRFTVDLSDIPVGSLGCAIAGGSTAGSNPLFGPDTRVCRNVQVSKLSGLDWLVGGSNYRLTGMDLTFYYLTTHRNNPADPYTQPPVDGSGNPLNSVQLPSTTIGVS